MPTIKEILSRNEKLEAPSGVLSPVKGKFFNKLRSRIKTSIEGSALDVRRKAKIKAIEEEGLKQGTFTSTRFLGMDLPAVPTNPLSVVSKDLIDTPERLFLGAKDIIKPPSKTVLEKREKDLRGVETYLDYKKVLTDSLEGTMKPKTINTLGNFYAGSLAFLDATIVFTPLRRAITEATRVGATKAAPEIIEAWTQLGFPKTLTEGIKSRNALMRSVHPDLVGGSPRGAQIVNNAWNLLKREGIPVERALIPRVAQHIDDALKPLDKIFNTPITGDGALRIGKDTVKTPVARDIGLKKLPGTRPVAGRGPAFGLSLGETEDVGRGLSKINKRLDILETEARKYKTAEAFLEQFEFTGRKGTYETLEPKERKPGGFSGVFTTPDENLAKTFGENIHTTYIGDKKIFNASNKQGLIDIKKFGETTPEQFINLKKEGYDGVRWEYSSEDGTNSIETQLFEKQKTYPNLNKSQLTDIYNKAKGGGKIILHKSLTQDGRVLVDSTGKQVLPIPVKEKLTPMENLSKISSPQQQGVQIAKGLDSIQKKTGSTEKIISDLKKQGVSQKEIDNIVLESGDKLVDTVKIKREKNGVLSAVLLKDTIADIGKGFKGRETTTRWVKRQPIKDALGAPKRFALDYYELPQLFFKRNGMEEHIWKPYRDAERNASIMKTEVFNEFKKEKLYRNVTEAFRLSTSEAKDIGKYYLTRQGKVAGANSKELKDLTSKSKKFVKIFDKFIADNEERVFAVARQHGKKVNKVENYAPLAVRGDFELVEKMSDIDAFLKTHPSFSSIKERVENVPFEMYEQDYRKVAARFIEQVSNFVNIGEVSPSLKLLTESEEFKSVVTPEVYDVTNQWREGTLETKPLERAEKVAKFSRTATSIASLAFNFASTVKQVLTLVPLTIIEKAPPKFRSKFAKDFGIKVSDLPALRERRGNVAIADLQNGIKKIGFLPLTETDRAVAQTALNRLLDIEYKKFLKEGKPISQETAEIIQYEAQEKLDMWFGGMTKGQLPKAFRGEVGKLLNMFIYPLTSQLNGFIYSAAKEQGWKQAEKIAEGLTAAIVIAYMEQVITNLSPKWSDTEEMVKDVLVSLTGNIPILSTIVYAVESDQPLAVSAALTGPSRLIKQVNRFRKGQADYGDVLFALGELFGLPKTVRRFTEGAELLRNEGLRDKNGKLLAPVKGTWEHIRGFLRGKYGTIATQDYVRNIGVSSDKRRWFVPEVEFLQNGDYDRKAQLYRQFNKRTKKELYNELSDGQQEKLDKALKKKKKGRKLSDFFK